MFNNTPSPLCDTAPHNHTHPCSHPYPSPNSISSGEHEGEGMLSGIFGRRRSSTSTLTSTPAISERDRLDIMDDVHSTLLDPHHSRRIHSHLAAVHASGRRSKVLDVGAGTARWAIHLANKQPYSDVTAIDIDWSSFAGRWTDCDNIDFQTIDVIHVKSLFLQVPHYTSLIERLAVILRPGGLLVVVESEPNYISATGKALPHLMQQWNACVREAYDQCGVDISLPSSLLECVAAPGVFQTPAHCQDIGMPCAGYMRGDSPKLVRVGKLHNSVIVANFRALIPTVLEYGYSPQQVCELVDECLKELSDPHKRYLQRLFAVCAYKIGM